MLPRAPGVLAAGAPSAAGRTICVPVFCDRTTACSARLSLRSVRTVWIRGRKRTLAGRTLATRRARAVARPTADVSVRLPARSRGGRVVVVRCGSATGDGSDR